MKTGAAVISKFLESKITSSGVYQFVNKNKEIIYIGKAKNLTRRLSDYLKPDTPKAEIILRNISDIIVLHTKNEYEALILEGSLIKKLKPRYNVLLKDDKSFPYIVIDDKSTFPQIIKYRGKDLKNKIAYGPFPQARELNKAIELLQKLFLLRSCSDSFFKSRTKPCILYQIKQCSAPCVNKISSPEYKELVKQVKEFLKGNTSSVYEKLFVEMNEASQKQDYEIAAKCRDRIKILSQIITQGNSLFDGVGDIDVICLDKIVDQIILQISFIRLGAIAGYQVIFVDTLDDSFYEVLSAFISSFYLKNVTPNEIYISTELGNSQKTYLEDILQQLDQRHTKIVIPKNGNKKKILDYFKSVLERTKIEKLTSWQRHKIFFSELESLLDISFPIKKIEIVDNSHCFGSHAVGAIVSCGLEGFQKTQYRRYNIKTTKSADDYAMLYEVISRRFAERNKYDLPHLMIIDGGKGHLKIVLDILKINHITNIVVIAIAKGKDRNSGNEIIYTNNDIIMLDKTSKLKQYIQVLRDEAHRVAISSYRKSALSSIDQSVLDSVPGIGKVRKRKLLTIFGSVKNLQKASLEEIRGVAGIDNKISKIIYQYLNKES